MNENLGSTIVYNVWKHLCLVIIVYKIINRLNKNSEQINFLQIHNNYKMNYLFLIIWYLKHKLKRFR